MNNRIINTSHTSLQKEKLAKLAKILIEKDYPPKLINKLLFHQPSIKLTITNTTSHL